MLDEVEAEGKIHPSAVAAFRLLMLTGCRRNEILKLCWQDVDLDAGELRLPDAKTGARSVAISPSARRVLANLPRLPDNPWVIAGTKRGARYTGLNNAWLVVCSRADLNDVRIHDPRHSFTSRALALGESLPMIGKLLGYRKVQTTARYAHLARDIWGNFGLGRVLRLPGLRGLLVVGMLSRKLCVFDNIWACNASSFPMPRGL